MDILKIKYKKKKKGAIELSLNLIIMLIIGLVILGLVIVFVRNMMNTATISFNTQMTAQDKENLQRVLQSSKPFDMYPYPYIYVNSNVPTKVYIEIRNLGSDTYKTKMGPMCSSGNCYTITTVSGNPVEGNKPLVLSCPSFNLDAGGKRAEMCYLTANLKPGKYFVDINVNNLLDAAKDEGSLPSNSYEDFSFTLIVK